MTRASTTTRATSPRRWARGALAVALTYASSSADAAVYFPGRWQLTQYWIGRERAGRRDRRAVPVRDREGKVLAWSCPRFVDELTMEGTGRTWDGRLLNWDARVHGQACFVAVDPDLYPFGVGVGGYALVPYRSLAVDRHYVPLGHAVEIPELAGLPLPDGSRHDGCFVAVDGGGAIRGHHIDLFVPSESAYRELASSGYLPSHVSGVVLDSPRCTYAAARFAALPVPSDPPLPR